MAPRVLCVLLITFQVVCASEPYRNDGLMDRLSSGMKFAQNLLGSESVALKVAEFVVRAFQTANKPATSNRRWPQNDLHSEESSASSESESYTHDKGPDYDVNETQSPLTPLRQIVRLFGLQPNQISAVAVNALVFVAQMISTFLSGPRRPSKPYRSEDPTTWILDKNSRSLQDLIAAAKNESLPDTIDELIQDQGTEEEISCIRLLVCKVTPFIAKMQKTVFGNEERLNDEKFAKELRGSAVMYRHLPTVEEINARNDICEQQHKVCNLNE
uniref:Proctolin peptide n=1 Tax=Heliothis virescens TaxID=7102 RepID=A0A2A4J6G1_HELVI